MRSLYKRLTVPKLLNNYPLLSSNPDILGGKVCINGTRISVAVISEWIASCASVNDIISQLPHLKESAVSQAIQYSANSLNSYEK